MALNVDFTVVLRGYDRAQVDALLRQVNEALASEDLARREAAADAVRDATFEVTWRGYHRQQVDHFIRRLPALLVEPSTGQA